MTVSMYQISVPVFVQMLSALSGVIGKAEDHARAKKLDEAFLLTMRLYPDMYPFVLQVQQCCSHAERICATLAGALPLSLPKDEKTFAELRASIAKTIAFLNSFTPQQFDRTEDRIVKNGQREFAGRILLLHRTLPHFYFHCTTAYDILRHCGVPLIKHDFIGIPPEFMDNPEELQKWTSHP